jgi:hypothetical protein
VTENEYQAKLIVKLKKLFPGCEILKNDSGYKQGILDLTILWGPFWAMLGSEDFEDCAKRPIRVLRREAQQDVVCLVHLSGEREGGARCASKSIHTSKVSTRF